MIKLIYKKYIFSALLVSLSSSLMAQHIIKEEGVLIDEIIVTGKVPPVVLKKDTTIINTSVYIVPEGSDLVDLVKRIPGLEYDEKNKTLKYNGKNINEINVNGEAFFMGNIRVALESLPADFVGKIKVYDKRSEEELATGIDDGALNYVLDIQTKEELNNTLLASVEAGGGNRRKKRIEAQLNYFRKGGENLSIVGESTNSGANTLSKDNMLTTAGTSFMQKFGEKHILRGNLGYDYTNQGNVYSYSMEQYLKEGNRYNSAINEYKNKRKSFDTNLKWQWKVNDRLILNMSARVDFGKTSEMSHEQSVTFSSDPELDLRNPFVNWEKLPNSIKINHNNKSFLSKSDNNGYRLGMDFTYTLNKKGTNVGISMDYNDSEKKEERTSDDITTYFLLKDEIGNDSVLFRNQYRHSPGFNRIWNTGISFTHPVSKKIRMQMFCKWKSEVTDNERRMYDLSELKKVYIDSLGYSNYERVAGYELGTYINYFSEIWKANASLKILPQQREVKTMLGEQCVDTALHVADYSSSIYVSWRENKLRISFKYNLDTRQPLLSDLVSLVDYDNPLYITSGNSDLKASYKHVLRLEIEDAKNNLFSDISWNIDQNSITHKKKYNAQTGGIVSYPVNINGNWWMRANMRWIKCIGKIEAYLQGEGGYSNMVTLMNENHTEYPERSVTRRTLLNGQLKLSYNPAWGGIDSHTFFRFERSLNSLRDNATYSRICTCRWEAYVDLPGNVQLLTEATATFRSGTNVQDDERIEILWNARARWRFLKGKQAELMVYLNDILAEQNEISRNSSAYGFSEFYTQKLKGYVMATFKYKFRVMK